jgi:hypothetical protein
LPRTNQCCLSGQNPPAFNHANTRRPSTNHRKTYSTSSTSRFLFFPHNRAPFPHPTPQNVFDLFDFAVEITRFQPRQARPNTRRPSTSRRKTYSTSSTSRFLFFPHNHAPPPHSTPQNVFDLFDFAVQNYPLSTTPSPRNYTPTNAASIRVFRQGRPLRTT